MNHIPVLNAPLRISELGRSDLEWGHIQNVSQTPDSFHILVESNMRIGAGTTREFDFGLMAVAGQSESKD